MWQFAGGKGMNPVCDYAGHDWQPAGGGLMICVQCLAEAWEDALKPESPSTPVSGEAARDGTGGQGK